MPTSSRILFHLSRLMAAVPAANPARCGCPAGIAMRHSSAQARGPAYDKERAERLSAAAVQVATDFRRGLQVRGAATVASCRLVRRTPGQAAAGTPVHGARSTAFGAPRR